MKSRKSLLTFHVVHKDDGATEEVQDARERAHLYRCLQIVASELAILESCDGNGFRCVRCRLMVSPDYKRHNEKCPYCRHTRFEAAQINESMMVDPIARWRDHPETRRSAQWQVDDKDLRQWIQRYEQRFVK